MIGGGSWGTAFARLLALSGHDTTLVCRDPEQARAIARRHRNPRYLFDVELPAALAAAGLDDADLSTVGAGRAGGSQPRVRRRGGQHRRRLAPEAVVLSLTKGLDPTSRRRMSELLGEVAAASGWPCFRGRTTPRRWPATTRPRRWWRAPRSSWRGGCRRSSRRPRLRVYASHDVVGVELCAAAKNVMGLAAGVSDGLGFGDNAKAAIITRGMAEMAGWARPSARSPGPTPAWPAWATWSRPAPRATRATGGPASCWPRACRRSWIESELGQVAEGLTTAPALRGLAAEQAARAADHGGRLRRRVRRQDAPGRAGRADGPRTDGGVRVGATSARPLVECPAE